MLWILAALIGQLKTADRNVGVGRVKQLDPVGADAVFVRVERVGRHIFLNLYGKLRCALVLFETTGHTPSEKNQRRKQYGGADQQDKGSLF